LLAHETGGPGLRIDAFCFPAECCFRSVRIGARSAGTIAQLAQSARLTYLAPREPVILGDVWRQVVDR
jgi:hypothetical protein